MRGGITGQEAGVHANTTVSQAHEEGHGSVFVEVGMVVKVFLGHGEVAGRRFMAGFATGDAAPRDELLIVVDVEALVGNGDDDVVDGGPGGCVGDEPLEAGEGGILGASTDDVPTGNGWGGMFGIVGGHVSLNRSGGEEGKKKGRCFHRLGRNRSEEFRSFGLFWQRGRACIPKW